MKIAHLSDLHIKDEESKFAAKELVADIMVRFRPGEIVVAVTGDIIDSPSFEEWTMAEDVFAVLVEDGYLVIFCLGNHDVAWQGLDDRDRFVQLAYGWLDRVAGLVVDDRSWPVVYNVGSDLAIISVNSNAGDNSLATGSVGYAQRIRVAKECHRAKTAGRQVVVLMHHHPMSKNLTLRLEDASDLLHTVSHRADVLLFGHLHIAAAWSDVWGIGRIYAADKSTESMRYRLLEFSEGVWRDRWVVI